MSEHGGHSPADWDKRYASSDRIWSGEPNHALTREVGALTPGRALDVGCGEGADAVWLARHGWEVSAIDPSKVALERAQRAAADAGVEISWWLGQLVEHDLPLESFDLVSAFYVPLVRDHAPVERLISLVAPGGTLLVVHHADFADHAIAHGRDPEELAGPDLVAEALADDDGWTVVVNERRERPATGTAGGYEGDDLVVKAVRVAS
ncbi:MAG TPA: class I SAM-dependent methyltransferase [Propionibacteriaceae bacterium]|nr:class I SAM-dependent methyltransferase [Propionibacteriaceae bacterium]